MFVGILLRDSARDFNVEIESSRHREIFEISSRAVQKLVKTIGSHLDTGPEGNSEFCFPRISMFPETKSRETLRFEGNKIHYSPRDQSLSDLLYSKTKRKQILNNALRFQQQRSTFRGYKQWTVSRLTS